MTGLVFLLILGVLANACQIHGVGGFIALRAQASAAQRSEESRLSGIKQAGVTRGKAGSSVEASESKQPLNCIVAPSKKASSKKIDAKELLLKFFCYVLCSRNQIDGSLHLVEDRCCHRCQVRTYYYPMSKGQTTARLRHDHTARPRSPRATCGAARGTRAWRSRSSRPRTRRRRPPPSSRSRARRRSGCRCCYPTGQLERLGDVTRPRTTATRCRR